MSADALLWQPGHWDWNGSGYAWQPGEYVPAAGHGALFQIGYWQQTPSGWVWVKAHWTALGIVILEGPVKRTGARGTMTSVYCRDPDGNLIEVASYQAW